MTDGPHASKRARQHAPRMFLQSAPSREHAEHALDPPRFGPARRQVALCTSCIYQRYPWARRGVRRRIYGQRATCPARVAKRWCCVCRKPLCVWNGRSRSRKKCRDWLVMSRSSHHKMLRVPRLLSVRIFAHCGVSTPLLRLPVRTRAEEYVCVHCAEWCGRGKERERRARVRHVVWWSAVAQF